MLRIISSLLLILPLFTATSCLKTKATGVEEIWINLDASGHLATRYEIPAIAMRKIGDPEKFISALSLIDEKEEGLTITKCTHETEDDLVTFILEAKFDNVLDLLEFPARHEDLFVEESASDPDQLSAVAGDIDLRLEGLRPAFDRDIHLSRALPSYVAKFPGMLGASNFTYVVHLPAKVKTTNAHSISNDGKTVTWNFLLKDYAQTPMTMSLTTEVPIPWWGWLVIVTLFLLLAYLIWRFPIRRFLKARNRGLTQEVDLPAA